MSEPVTIFITSFYRFMPLSKDEVTRIHFALESFARNSDLRGLCLLGSEGINATLSGTQDTISQAKKMVREFTGIETIDFKDSTHAKHPFNTFKVKIKDEIVTMGQPDTVPFSGKHGHLTAEQWSACLSDPNTVILDTRNDYEVEIGKFKNAIDLNLKEFREFPEALKNSQLDKSKRILIYCTGGIRCEKAILEMNQQGYNEVYQLDGGILNYLQKFPNQDFAGECFVFDYRVAVDQNLQPTRKYKLCPHCGQPANLPIECKQCGDASVICKHCAGQGPATCSKNCAHHYTIGSRSRKRAKISSTL